MTGKSALNLVSKEHTDLASPDLGALSFDGNVGAGMFFSSPLFEKALKRAIEDIQLGTSLIVLTGETGTGKTVLVRQLIEKLGKDVTPILLIDPRFSFHEFAHFACRELGLGQPSNGAEAAAEEEVERLREFLTAQRRAGRSVTVFIDEAQEMADDLLVKLLALSDSMVADENLLQIVLVGLPALREHLRQPALRKFALRKLTRRALRMHKLRSLPPTQIAPFIRQRLDGVDGRDETLFSADAIEKIGIYSRGIPRTINALCSLAIFTSQLERRRPITGDLIDEAHQRLLLAPTQRPSRSSGSTDLNPADVSSTTKPPPPSPTATVSRFSEYHSRPTRPANSEREQERMMSRLDSLNKILKKLQNESPGVEASALISEDGLMIASALPQDLDETHVGGMTATLLNLGTRAATELRRGEVQEVIVRGEEGYAVMISAGRGVLLLVLANEHAKLGLIFFDMREAITALKSVL